MKKKLYTVPLSEVTQLGSDVIMEAFSSASMPTDPFGAPVRNGAGPNRTPVF